MHLKNSFFSILAAIGLITLAGCARYKAHPLRKLVTKTSSKSTEQTVSFASHALSKGECKHYLDRDLIKKGYQPVLMTFNNNSDRYLTLSKENFSLPCASADEVAKTVHTNTTGRAVGYGVAAFVCMPLIIPTIAFGTSAIVDGIGSSEANHELDADFAHKALQNQIIAPRGTVSGLVFVPTCEFSENFSLTLLDQETGDRFALSPSKPELKV